MIEVLVYSRSDCHLCEQVIADLQALQVEVPHRVSVIDIDQDPVLQKKLGLEVPIVEIGPYTLKAPIDPKDLEITIKAARHRLQQIESVDRAIETGRTSIVIPWTSADRFNYWLSRHYLAFFNLFILIYIGLPFLAPVLMKTGATAPAGVIYRAYGLVCHQLAFRSWFIFGEQLAYPRASAEVDGLVTLREATGLNEEDLLANRIYQGDSRVGFKIALCQRDFAIYAGILMFGLLFGLTFRKIKGLPWYFWILLGIIPIGLDGGSQLLSQPPLEFLPLRESTPLLRTITGWLFGFCTAWFGYPLVEESMNDTRQYMETKLLRIHQQRTLKNVGAKPGD